MCSMYKLYIVVRFIHINFVSFVDSGLSVSGWPAGGETVSWRQC